MKLTKRECLVYDIQTSYKGAVYSVKLKMEFTILNQLMNLVRGNLSDHNVTNTPSKSHHYARHTGSGGSAIRQSMRPSGNSALGHSAGAYSRMDDKTSTVDSIKMQNLRSTEVLKTTTTEVRVDSIDRVIPDDEETASKSATSSEVYIIEPNKR